MIAENAECQRIVDGAVPMHNDIPETFHSLQFLSHLSAKHASLHQVDEDIFIGSRNAKMEIGIQDGADVKDILDGVLQPLVNTVFH